MKILSVETSCDDTGVAILKASDADNLEVLANVVASQIKVHKKYGGVYPMMAKREHQKNLVPTLTQALKKAQLLEKRKNPVVVNFARAKFTTTKKILEREPELLKKLIPFLQKYQKPDIDLIALTNGPGLEPCLWVGVNFAKALSFFWNIPIVPVNHIEGHILVNFLENKNIYPVKSADKVGGVSPGAKQFNRVKFPAIALVVSGGHTQIILVKKIGSYKIIGETRDDAAGECFDKCAKILGLGYPGGPAIAKLAVRHPMSIQQLDGHRVSIQLPRPMINTKDYDFSFSGLKTAVLYADRKIINKNKKYKQEMAVEIQQAVIDVLLKKTIKAAKDYNAKTIILGGGVSANQEFRTQFLEKFKNVIFPKPELSTDNGLMIAIAGYFNRAKKIGWKNIQADANLRID